MKDLALVPESHQTHRRRAGLGDWSTALVCLIVTVGFVASISVTPGAAVRPESAMTSAGKDLAVPSELAGTPCRGADHPKS